MKDQCVGQLGGYLNAFDFRAFERGARITLGGMDHRQRRFVFPRQGHLRQTSASARLQHIQQIGFQPWQHHLAFGITEAHIIFDEFGASVCEHQTRKQYAFERRAARLHGFDGR